MPVNRAKSLADRTPVRRVNVYLNDRRLSIRERELAASMLRGIACGVSGFKVLAGKTNQHFVDSQKVMFQFSSVQKTDEFLDTCDKFIAPSLLSRIKVNQRARYH